MLSGILPNPKLETSVLSVWYVPYLLKTCAGFKFLGAKYNLVKIFIIFSSI